MFKRTLNHPLSQARSPRHYIAEVVDAQGLCARITASINDDIVNASNTQKNRITDPRIQMRRLETTYGGGLGWWGSRDFS